MSLNENNDFFRKIALKTLKERGLESAINNGAVTLYHGTSEKNATKIESGGKFLGHPYFTHDKAIAEKYARMTGRGKVRTLELQVDINSLVPATDYFAARMEGMYRDSKGVWRVPGTEELGNSAINKDTVLSAISKFYDEHQDPHIFESGSCFEFAISVAQLLSESGINMYLSAIIRKEIDKETNEHFSDTFSHLIAVAEFEPGKLAVLDINGDNADINWEEKWDAINNDESEEFYSEFFYIDSPYLGIANAIEFINSVSERYRSKVQINKGLIKETHQSLGRLMGMGRANEPDELGLAS